MNIICATCGEPIVTIGSRWNPNSMKMDRTFNHAPVADAAIVACCADVRGDDLIEATAALAR